MIQNTGPMWTISWSTFDKCIHVVKMDITYSACIVAKATKCALRQINTVRIGHLRASVVTLTYARCNLMTVSYTAIDDYVGRRTTRYVLYADATAVVIGHGDHQSSYVPGVISRHRSRGLSVVIGPGDYQSS